MIRTLQTVYTTARTTYVLFAFIFMACALLFWLLHSTIIDERQNYVFTQITNNRYLSIVAGYIIVYAIMSLIFSILFIVLKLYDRKRKDRIWQYGKVFLILFIVGLFLYLAAWCYWDLVPHLSGMSYLYWLIVSYISDIFEIYFKGILLWMVGTSIGTFIFLRMKLA